MAYVNQQLDPTVNPTPEAPNSYQNVQPTAAKGMVDLGQGASQAAGFYTQAAADDAFNQFMDGTSKILHGDPSKTITGPDGTPIPDTGYLGLKGKAALDARLGVEEKINTLYQQTREGLLTPEQEQQFETYSRRFRTNAMIDIGSHVDQQSNVWYTQVNGDTAKNALDAISTSPTDSKTVLSSAAQLTQAYTQQAELEGAQRGDPVWNNAVIRARRDSFKAQVTSIGASDPARAMRMLEASPDLAGQDYATLYRDFRTRSIEQDGIQLGQSSLGTANANAGAANANSYSNPDQPIYRQTAAAAPGGLSASGLARTIQIESGGNPDAANASGHVGLGQFSDETWRTYGGGASRTDPEASIMATARLAQDNARILGPRLGRPPTDAELYLAHQQGAEGAARLLTNPNASAASMVGLQAVEQNLPSSMRAQAATMTAGQFAAYWTGRFNGTTPAEVQAQSAPMTNSGTVVPIAPSPDDATAPVQQTNQPAAVNTGVTQPPAPTEALRLSTDTSGQQPSVRASATQAILASDASPEVKQRALTYVAQQYQAQQIAADQTAQQIKLQSDQQANVYMTQMLNGSNLAGMSTMIANDPKLTWETKEALSQALIRHADDSTAGASAAFGPGFWSAYQQIAAPPGDPARLSDPAAILRRAGPGGDLTLAGAQKLITEMSQATKSVDDQAVTTTKSALINYAKSKLSYQQDTGPIQIKDPKGEAIFSSRFVPQFMSAYDQWVKSGKNPWDFLTQDNVDKMVSSLRNPREMALSQLMAQSGGVDVSQLKAPPAPDGADPTGWKLIVNEPPTTKDGKAWPMQNWAAAINLLASNPTPDAVAAFDQKFGTSIKANDILSVLNIHARKPAETAGSGVVPPTSAPGYPGEHAMINGKVDLGLPMPGG